MLLGTYEGRLDAQGRIVVPQRCREPLEEGMILARGLDGQIDAYPPAQWTEEAERIERFSAYNRNARLAQRLMFSGAHKAAMDRQGRVVVPAWLRNHAGIGEEVVITGVNTKLEIWSKERWAEQEAQAANLASIAETLEKTEPDA